MKVQFLEHLCCACMVQQKVHVCHKPYLERGFSDCSLEITHMHSYTHVLAHEDMHSHSPTPIYVDVYVRRHTVCAVTHAHTYTHPHAHRHTCAHMHTEHSHLPLYLIIVFVSFLHPMFVFTQFTKHVHSKQDIIMLIVDLNNSHCNYVYFANP